MAAAAGAVERSRPRTCCSPASRRRRRGDGLHRSPALAARPRALAIVDDGATLVGGRRWRPGRRRRRRRSTGARSSQPTPSPSAAAKPSRWPTTASTAGRPEARRSARGRPPARANARLRPDARGRWVATGARRLDAPPTAATWTERTRDARAPGRGAATLGERTWLAIDDQLSSSIDMPGPTTAAAARVAAPTRHGARARRRWRTAVSRPRPPLAVGHRPLRRGTADARSARLGGGLLVDVSPRHAGRPARPTDAVAAERVRRDEGLAARGDRSRDGPRRRRRNGRAPGAAPTRKRGPAMIALARREPARVPLRPGAAGAREPYPRVGRGGAPARPPLPMPEAPGARRPPRVPTGPPAPATFTAARSGGASGAGRRDPPVAALRAAATALALAEPERAHSLVERARLAGWLPELRIRVDRRFARTESVDLGTPSDGAAAGPGRHRQRQRRALRGARDLGSVEDRLQPRRDRRAVPGPAHRRHASRDRVAGHPSLLRAAPAQGRVERLPMTWTCFQVRDGSCASRRSRRSWTL